MISLQGVPSTLIARNESWVRREASSLARRMPSNIEKADLIQVGLIAVAQASIGFIWEGDPDSEEGREAFIRYARSRVKGAMLDELRHMDTLGRDQRRKVKVIQIARERWQAIHGVAPNLTDLSGVCSMSIDEISELEHAALMAQTESLTNDPNDEAAGWTQEPATAADEVEARVDTAIVMRRLEKYFATLPERERQVIDTYLGVGLTPAALAKSWKVTPSRVSQFYVEVCRRLSIHFGHSEAPAVERRRMAAARLEEQIVAREAELRPTTGEQSSWGELMEDVLTRPMDSFVTPKVDANGRLQVDADTRWG